MRQLKKTTTINKNQNSERLLQGENKLYKNSMSMGKIESDAYCIGYMKSFIIFTSGVSYELCLIFFDLCGPCAHSTSCLVVYLAHGDLLRKL